MSGDGFSEYQQRRHRHPYDKRRRRPCCVKCGNEGHVYKDCTEPISSFGIIAINRDGAVHNGPFLTAHTERCALHLGAAPDAIPAAHVSSGSDILQYLMVQRKDTMGYIDFIRGRWPENDAAEKTRALTTYLEEMTCEERKRLRTHDFESLWDMIWVNHTSRIYINEFMEARRKYQKLNLARLLGKTTCNWTQQEYGFPKGRKNRDESNLDCALREFKEETGYGRHQVRLLSLNPYEENFIGTNGIAYRHVYYMAEILTETGSAPKIPIEEIRKEGEIANIAWLTYEQAHHIIRPYDTAKKALLSAIHSELEAQGRPLAD